MGGRAGGAGGYSPQFLPNFCKISLFASNFSISMPSAPSRSSQPPHFQIHSAVNGSFVNVKTKKQLTQISHLLENGNRIDDPTKIGNIFNNHSVNVASNIDRSIPRTRKSPTDYLKNRNADSMFLSPVTEQEIEFIIQSLNSQKSVGPCSIPVFLLKTLTKHIAKPFSTSLFKLAFFLTI